MLNIYNEGEFMLDLRQNVSLETLQKKWYRHTGYIGHLKETRYDTLMATRPTKAMELAVKGMLPKNKVGDASFGRLKVYAGSEHKQQAQQPIAID